MLSLKSLDNPRGNSYIPYLSLILRTCFSCGRKKLLKYKNVSKYYNHEDLQTIFLLFLLLLTAPILKKNHILTVIYIIFIKTSLAKLESC